MAERMRRVSCVAGAVLTGAMTYEHQSGVGAQVSVAALSFVLGSVAVTGSYVMKLIPKTRALQRVLVHAFRAQPPFLLGEGLIELTRFNFEKDIAEARSGGDGAGGARADGHSVADAHWSKLRPALMLHPFISPISVWLFSFCCCSSALGGVCNVPVLTAKPCFIQH